MTAKEYLSQAYRLDQRIRFNTSEALTLREMAESIIAIPLDKERVQTSQNTDAVFVRVLERMWEREKEIADELERLSELKNQLSEVIRSVHDTDERMVLEYRYLRNYTWKQIADELYADTRTVQRWHGRALQSVILPENPIKI